VDSIRLQDGTTVQAERIVTYLSNAGDKYAVAYARGQSLVVVSRDAQGPLWGPGHTSEPWHVSGTPANSICAHGEHILTAEHDYNMNLATVRANLDRVAACVNACKGINPAAVPKLLKLARAVACWDDSPDGQHETLNRLGLLATAALLEARQASRGESKGG